MYDAAGRLVLSIDTDHRTITVPEGVQANDAAKHMFEYLKQYMAQCRGVAGMKDGAQPYR